MHHQNIDQIQRACYISLNLRLDLNKGLSLIKT